mmetsp:Transcript_2228/g.5056  ORF Transcript_2228/g.5056 Transcript_2228/m.5056 type:complete len:257 (+) Transcript_2228:375-1145(+)|eukprot:CAMPEP_0172395298 /NCGR_PEP_ID=MMETSP1061-20121228/18752_1 /TAXON_ID=37318 /ORGANISM="Pseudo-nitzschia pungens, Strain cf. pungens" /LENGTH=256 /DNA_ID=CAMNT_0013126819 /DNA_START=300 /DNA_END=1070 /DNA_ORIENTATION=-
MRSPTIFLLLSALFALSASAFQPLRSPCVFLSRASSRTATQTSPTVVTTSCPLALDMSAHFASGDESTASEQGKVSFPRMVRNRLRKATGFSFTVFRATLRGITGISLTTLYAGTLAATGLWIRKTMSVILSVFPSGFRYFLQPLLVLYYTPLILLRSMTSPTNRKQAVAKHETVVEAWKEAVTMAEKTEKSGYWPVAISEDGYFELAKPPSVDGSENAKMAEAMAEAVEHAMEVKSELASASNGSESDEDADERK